MYCTYKQATCLSLSFSLTHTHTHTCTHTHAHTHTNTHTRTHPHAHTRTHVHTHIRTHVHAHTRTHVHARTRTHTHTHARTHTHTHGQTLYEDQSNQEAKLADINQSTTNEEMVEAMQQNPDISRVTADLREKWLQIQRGLKAKLDALRNGYRLVSNVEQKLKRLLQCNQQLRWVGWLCVVES